jgi:hypothetical protein
MKKKEIKIKKDLRSQKINLNNHKFKLKNHYFKFLQQNLLNKYYNKIYKKQIS